MNNPYGEEAPLVDMTDFTNWIVQEDDSLLIVNKPGWLVCHPSKNGPMSSLVGVVREYTGADKLHLVARLDRETSGLIVFAKRPAVARKFQMAIQNRIVKKAYIALIEGELQEARHVDLPIARRRKGGGPVIVKSEVSYDRSSQDAVTDFIPLLSQKGYTLCRVQPETGRKHQIRVHAEEIKHRIVGDKIYGPDETLYIEFIENGWTERLAAALPIQRQALHCHRYDFQFPEGTVSFTAPLQADMLAFCENHMDLSATEITAAVGQAQQ
ncbi:RNA pseudouridine synthase [Coraliomargarita sp. SDUM461004]|uniref:RNA pseudouridine synthase n=1 Tax=Thalassobacterium sedimentorum TaxID=3041258 RepID=A0ABU1ANL0_9BACT|nr:RNA pseudouridine synthase [Coraliomargarita sp. SDUM461004]MDQ8196385.1 RNA pseudouridine synthase [Coraliomargarita sp. SDUM461004]